MMPFLTTEAMSYLAGHYPLSGGQLENISRKCAVEFILDGRSPEMEVIEQMCEQESIRESKRARIGFCLG